MRLYLVQHAEAKGKDEDPDRPLTERGRKAARQVAGFVAQSSLRAERILHSGKTRARQTAEVFAGALDPDEVGEQKGLAPLDDPGGAAGLLTPEEGSLMLVGHLPHLRRLAGLLLCGDIDSQAVRFRNAGVVALADGGDGWALQWAVIPELLSGQVD